MMRPASQLDEPLANTQAIANHRELTRDVTLLCIYSGCFIVFEVELGTGGVNIANVSGHNANTIAEDDLEAYRKTVEENVGVRYATVRDSSEQEDLLSALTEYNLVELDSVDTDLFTIYR